jgi:hypothetical protein
VRHLVNGFGLGITKESKTAATPDAVRAAVMLRLASLLRVRQGVA